MPLLKARLGVWVSGRVTVIPTTAAPAQWQVWAQQITSPRCSNCNSFWPKVAANVLPRRKGALNESEASVECHWVAGSPWSLQQQFQPMTSLSPAITTSPCSNCNRFFRWPRVAANVHPWRKGALNESEAWSVGGRVTVIPTTAAPAQWRVWAQQSPVIVYDPEWLPTCYQSLWPRGGRVP